MALRTSGRLIWLFVLFAFASCDTRGPIGPAQVPEITVLFVYTPGVAAAVPDLEALLDEALDDTHQAYDNSGVSLRLRRVYVAEVEYALTERRQDLARLMAVDDGFLDEVHALRDQHEADVVVLVAEDREATINGAILATPETAFAVVYYGTLGAPDYALAHELGHLQGARHSPEADPALEPFAYGHGLRNEAWKTIMSTGPVPAIPHFSNPAVSYEGRPTGTADLQDVARVLNETAAYVAGFRGSSE